MADIKTVLDPESEEALQARLKELVKATRRSNRSLSDISPVTIERISDEFKLEMREVEEKLDHLWQSG